MVMVLFVCTGNAARSQIAEGWLKSMKPGLTVVSAGTKPERLSSMAVKAMLEVGLNISDQTSKHLAKVPWEKADYAITLCGSANEECVNMNWPKTCVREHWPIEDPETEDDFRKARDEIKTRIKVWIKALQH
jgi:arsenate reductase